MADLLSECDVSATEFAKRIGVRHQVVTEYRKGTKTPQFATVLRMADAFSKPLEYFVEDVDRA